MNVDCSLFVLRGTKSGQKSFCTSVAKAKKKMSNLQSHLALVTAVNATRYLPAALHKYPSGWLIDYYVEDPQTQKLQRKKIKVTRIMSRYTLKSDGLRHVNSIVAALNIRLASGWNPLLYTSDNTEPIPVFEPINVSKTIPVATLLTEQANPGECIVIAPKEEKQPTEEELRLQTPFVEVCEKYLQEVRKEKRPDTVRSYNSFVSIFKEWIEKQSPGISSSMISHVQVVRFMDYVYNERKGQGKETISNRTYNNYTKNGSAFFSWMVEKCYCNENHFSKLKRKKKEDKIRILIPEEAREKITTYLQTKKPNYLLMLKLIYNSLIRPKEIRNLLVSDISLAKGQITVRKGVSKNDKERIVPMTQDLIEDFTKLNLQCYSSNCYVFGKDTETSKIKMKDNYMHKYWGRMRKKLNLPKEMQQYSLRDSGMFEMIKGGIDPLSVKQLADHHSLEMTAIYTNHVDPNLQKIVYEHSPTF